MKNNKPVGYTVDPLFHDDIPAPKKRRRRKTPKKDSEAAVLRECLLYLRKCSEVVYLERRNTGTIEFEDGSFIQYGSPGAADIFCLIRCRSHGSLLNVVDHLYHIEIEVKRRDGKGRLSPAQQSFKQFCKKSGIPYFVVTSKENLIEQLKKAGML